MSGGGAISGNVALAIQKAQLAVQCDTEKTSLLNCIRTFFNLPTVEVLPTVGQNMLKVKWRHLHYTILDLGGQKNFREAWSMWFEDIDAILFVADSTAPEKFDEVQGELERILNSPALSNVPVMICANKQDVSTAMTTDAIERHFNLHAMIPPQTRPWAIRGTSVLNSEAGDVNPDVNEVLEWVLKTVRADENMITRVRERAKTQDQQRAAVRA